MATTDPYEFATGFFEWDNVNNELRFISGRETVAQESPVILKKAEKEIKKDKYEIEFKEDIDLIDKIKFKKNFRRKEFLDEPTVILLQDIKDVTLFTANPKNLPTDFILFLHTQLMDKFFRALIIYFQFYFQTWESLKNRREEMKVKILQKAGSVLENIARDDLSDLRSMVAREYFSMIIGAGEASKFHHVQSTVLLSERDRSLCECLIQFAARVVWYALNKPSLGIIRKLTKQEVDRIARSWYFNKFEHVHSLQNKPMTKYTDREKQILRGSTDFEQTRLKAMTPVGKEILIGTHDHRMLSIGQVDFPPSDDRIRFLEKLYLLPEEEFAANGICIGILGMPRDHFDVMLKPKRKKTHGEERGEEKLVFTFEIPRLIDYKFDEVHLTYPSTPPRIQQSDRTKLLMTQAVLWLNRTKARTSASDKMEQSLNYTLESCTSLY